MKPTELRIGDYVKFERGQYDFPEIQLDKHGFGEHVIKHNAMWIHPISLTEEWLKKFGFKEHKTPHGWGVHPDYIKDNWYSIWIDKEKDNELYFGVDMLDEGHITLTKIKYVHSLQNLYFALTEKELTIKE